MLASAFEKITYEGPGVHSFCHRPNLLPSLTSEAASEKIRVAISPPYKVCMEPVSQRDFLASAAAFKEAIKACISAAAPGTAVHEGTPSFDGPQLMALGDARKFVIAAATGAQGPAVSELDTVQDVFEYATACRSGRGVSPVCFVVPEDSRDAVVRALDQMAAGQWRPSVRNSAEVIFA